MAEEIESLTGTTEEATADSDSSYGKILEGDAAAPPKSEAGVVTEEETTPEVEKKVLPVSQQDEIILEIGGKEYPVKQAELLEYLSNTSKFAEREKSLLEKEKSLNRDYTQKSQQNSEFRKSFESIFGGELPSKPLLESLGRIYQKSFKNQEYAQALNAMAEGFSVMEALGGKAEPKSQNQESAYVSQLESKIQSLEDRLGDFTSSYEKREETERVGQAQKSWQAWVDNQAKEGVKITDEIDQKMAPFISALKDSHADWETSKILDTAYRHATIDDLEKTAKNDVLKSADKAKVGNIPKIKPKSSAKSDSEKTYAEIFNEQ